MSSPDPVHELTAAERHRMTVDEAVAQLTHKCRRYPGLKLKPEACEKRQSKRQKIFRGKSYPIFDGCSDCPGPVPIGAPDEPASEPKPVTPSKTRKKRLKPTVCSECGRGPGQVHFYPSNPYQCAVCLRARDRARTAAAKSWTPIEEDSHPVKEAPEELPDEQQTVEREAIPAISMRYTCDAHGPHNGRMFGKQHSRICPKCHSLKMSEKMREIHSREKARPNAAPLAEITLPDWITAWAEEQGAEQGIHGKEIVIGLIGKLISSDWLKSWLINQSINKEA